MSMRSRGLVLASVAALCIATALYVERRAMAADHTDPPAVAGDGVADIDDFYAWHTDDGNLVAIVTFAGLAAPAADQTGSYDRDLLYGIHIDTDDDVTNGAEETIWARFGQDGDGDWGVHVEGIPGTTEAVEGAVETELSDGSDHMAWAGLRDDPFFFDLEGFHDTLSTGTLSFDSARDSFAGTNVTAIVVRFPVADVDTSNPLQLWATTSRIGG